jgi:hypothetical protein
MIDGMNQHCESRLRSATNNCERGTPDAAADGEGTGKEGACEEGACEEGTAEEGTKEDITSEEVAGDEVSSQSTEKAGKHIRTCEGLENTYLCKDRS